MARLAYAMAALAAALLCGTAARADEVRLQDGSLLIGTIQDIGDGRVLLETGFAGVLELNIADIEGVVTDAPAVIAFLDASERLEGRLLVVDGAQRIDTLRLGVVGLDLATLAALWRPGETPPVLAEAKKELEAVTEAYDTKIAELEEQLPDPDALWNGNVELGFSGATGNTERLAFQGRVEGRRTTDFDRLTLSAEARFAREDGNETQNLILARSRLERDFSPRYFAAGDVSLEQDQLEDLDLRLIAIGSIGYFLIKDDDRNHSWQIDAGFSYRQEFFESGLTEEEPGFSLRSDYAVELGKLLRFSHRFSYLPTLTDPIDDFRIESDARLVVPLADSSAWTLNFGVLNQFDSQPPETAPGQDPIEELDTVYNVSIGYRF